MKVLYFDGEVVFKVGNVTTLVLIHELGCNEELKNYIFYDFPY